MQYWEIVAGKLSAAGWTWGYCSAVTQDGWRWVVDAHSGDGSFGFAGAEASLKIDDAIVEGVMELVFTKGGSVTRTELDENLP